MPKGKKFLSLTFFLLPFFFSFGQEKQIRIVRADALQFDKEHKNAQQLIGNVIFEHDSAFLHCDTALLYTQENSFVAYGNIRINQGDSVRITADTLNYSGKTKQAELSGNVFFSDGKIQLTTPKLHYDLNSKIGTYTQGAVITSQENNNRLTSKIGIYNNVSKTFRFQDSVVLTNPRYTITADTLTYNTDSEISFFSGSTHIKSDSNAIDCSHGWYNTKTEQSSFWGNSTITTGNKILSGDSIYYDRNKGTGEAFGNVSIVDSTNDIKLLGQYAFYNEIIDSSLITQNAILIQYYPKDTLYLTADTLIVKQDSITKTRLFRAFHKVLLFKSDLQARCDSLVYSEQDSLMLFRNNPTIWSENHQLSGKEIDVVTSNGDVHQLKIRKKAIIISKADSLNHYDQIQGRYINGIFGKNNLLQTIWVKGNGEVLYFLGEDKKPITDVNHTLCSDMKISIVKNEIDRIHFYNKPTAKLTPLSNTTQKDLFLSNFKWNENERPTKNDFLELLSN